MRSAAKDSSLDILGLDVVWEAEFAEAGWIEPRTGQRARQVEQDAVRAALDTATWKGQLVAAPFNSNTQLLWYRKDLVPSVGSCGRRDARWRAGSPSWSARTHASTRSWRPPGAPARWWGPAGHPARHPSHPGRDQPSDPKLDPHAGSAAQCPPDAQAGTWSRTRRPLRL